MEAEEDLSKGSQAGLGLWKPNCLLSKYLFSKWLSTVNPYFWAWLWAELGIIDICPASLKEVCKVIALIGLFLPKLDPRIPIIFPFLPST